MITEHAARVEDWKPAAACQEYARRELARDQLAECVILAMVQPGKEYGWWGEGGHEVATLSDYFVVSPARYDYGAARNAAVFRALEVRRARFGGDGTVAYAVVNRDSGIIPVYEYLESR